MLFDQIDRPVEHEAAIDRDRIAEAGRIASLIVQPEAERSVDEIAVGEQAKILR